MKKRSLFIVAAAALALIALPVNAQKKVSLQEVQKAEQVNQAAQNGTTIPTGSQATSTTTSAISAGVPAGQVAPSQVAPPPPAPLTCTWDITDYDFGKDVIQLKPASATFYITNAGKEPVTITLVQTSCGCTSPKYTKEPIKPGEKGEVVLTYDAKVSGYFSKSAQVKLNDGQKYALTIKGEVQKAQ